MVHIGCMYRHFKGGIYIVNNLAVLESDRNITMVVYTSIKDGKVWVRELKDFTAIIKNRPDNVTGQERRFVQLGFISDELSAVSTKELLNELDKRPDNPYDSIKPLESDPDVWDIHFSVGWVDKIADEEGKVHESFYPVTQKTFEDYESALAYARSCMIGNRELHIVRRVTRKVNAE